MTERTILAHGDVLLVGAVVALLAGPDGGQVHQRSASNNADRELRLA
jgi:hypothetical protein